ncbi:sialate O-acetylesterase [Luteolibacter algae]|uniref:Sialate O-acetylesterase n=1 Tax=Luteolibacter algae TaxID=454151 RepID=A0ABW5D6C9_9BACT
MKNNTSTFYHRLAAAITLLASPLLAEVQPAMVFTDGAVLQREEPVRIWGKAAVGEIVTVDFTGQKCSATADEAGEWMVTLEPLATNAVGEKLTFTGTETPEPIVLEDVLVGEVWLAGGQSNMASTMTTYRKVTQPDIDSANDPLLRCFTVPRLFFPEQKPMAGITWKPSNPQTVGNFTATGYYFAKNLREKLNVPIGIISCSVGGTPAEAWMSRETLASKPDLKRIIDSYDQHVANAYKDEADYLNQLQEFENAVKAAAKEGKKKPKPQELMGPRNFKRPAGLHEGMLTKVIPSTIRGVIWYQGENNASSSTGFHYRRVFSTLIEEWRKEFRNPQLPFLFVQLATLDFKDGPEWPELRDSQLWVEENVANTGMVVAADGGERKDIHPHSKKLVGSRLSLLARNMVYGEEDLVARGPYLKRHRVVGSAIELDFKNTGSGLVLKKSPENPFEIAGADGEFFPAQAQLIDDKIRVSAESVSEPKFVRYGWHKWFIPTIYNTEDLPASPFQTGNLPAATEGRFLLDSLNK